MKVCYQCKKNLPDGEFYRDNRSDDLLTSSCKNCQKLRARKRYYEVPLGENTKQKKAERFQKWKEENPDRYRELTKRSNERRLARGRGLKNPDEGGEKFLEESN